MASLAHAEVGVRAWTYETLKSAYGDSGRNLKLSSAGFDQIQKNKERALTQIEKYLSSKFGSADSEVLRAFREVPREYFHYNYSDKRSFAEAAYEDQPKPWAIGYGSALSDYLGQAYMTQLAAPKPDSVVLEIGTGSGFQSSLLSRIAKRVYSIEIIEPLGKGVAKIYKPLNYANVETRVGDGYFGWPEVSTGFDIIIVTCAAEYVPPALIAQLKPGGRMLIPIGQPFKKGQILYVYTKDESGKVRSKKDVGVFFIPMTGEAMKKQRTS
jgi:protein-L-isoaspartate(D-aspartate) O-methyltransferase